MNTLVLHRRIASATPSLRSFRRLETLESHLYRAGRIERFRAGIELAQEDDSGVGDPLAVVAIEDSHVRAGRPVGDVPDFVRMRPFPLFRDCSRQMGELFPAEQ